MGTVLLVRHGESEANGGGWYSGHVDVALTPRGLAQAERLVGLLADAPIDRILSSDLRRAYETAVPVARVRGLEVEAAPPLRERDLGAWTRRRVDPADHALHEVLHSFTRRPPLGESLADVAARAAGYLATLPWEGATLIAAHGGVLRALLGLLDGLDEHELVHRRVDNAAVFRREVSGASWEAAAARARAAATAP